MRSFVTANISKEMDPSFCGSAVGTGSKGLSRSMVIGPIRRGVEPIGSKAKCVQREEFVIGGFTEPAGSRQGFGALLIGYFDGDGQLLYAGRVGTGFSDENLVALRRALEKLKHREPTFSNLTAREAGKDVHWVEPKLVCQVEFTNWTRDRMLRHPSFQGLREDLRAKDVVRDAPVPGGLAEAPPAAQVTAKNGANRAAHSARSKSGRAKNNRPAVHAPKQAGASGYHLQSAAEERIAGVRVTHPDRIVYPDAGVTKRDIANFYVEVADWILPHVTRRPLSLVRCPEGQGKPCFFQKNAGRGMPDVLGRITIESDKTSTEFCVVNDVAGLIALVQMGVLEIHPWGATIDNIERPDRLIFDLDPGPEVEWSEIALAARRLRELLTDLELESFLKTTGGKGLHLVVPIARRLTWDDAKAFSRGVVERLAAQFPNDYVTKAAKNVRQNKIFLDYLRNDRGSTAVVAYSTRARSGAPVSTPLAWEELTKTTAGNTYTVKNLPARLSRLKRDPWAELLTSRQAISAKARRIVEA